MSETEVNTTPQIKILAQYVKDSSFENPNAPQSLQSDKEQPEINLNVNVQAKEAQNNIIEVSLIIKADAKRKTEIVFIAELEYAGLFSFVNIEKENQKPFVLIECPRLLFPFARQIFSEIIGHGGYPPLMLEPIDFTALYNSQNQVEKENLN